jgi:hypothetical protein
MLYVARHSVFCADGGSLRQSSIGALAECKSCDDGSWASTGVSATLVWLAAFAYRGHGQHLGSGATLAMGCVCAPFLLRNLLTGEPRDENLALLFKLDIAKWLFYVQWNHRSDLMSHLILILFCVKQYSVPDFQQQPSQVVDICTDMKFHRYCTSGGQKRQKMKKWEVLLPIGLPTGYATST